MRLSKINIGNLFLITAVIMLLLGLSFGLLAAFIYLYPEFLKNELGFTSLRPLHVSSAMFWIILGATGCVYNGLRGVTKQIANNKLAITQWILWIVLER